MFLHSSPSGLDALCTMGVGGALDGSSSGEYGVVAGLAEDADLTSVNRAARLTDGQRVYVPRVGEQVAPVEGDGSAGAAGERRPSSTTARRMGPSRRPRTSCA